MSESAARTVADEKQSGLAGSIAVSERNFGRATKTGLYLSTQRQVWRFENGPDPGFLRGLCFHGDYAVIGPSKPRNAVLAGTRQPPFVGLEGEEISRYVAIGPDRSGTEFPVAAE